METQKVIKIDLFLNLSKSLNWILCTYGSWKQILFIFFYNGTLIVMHTHIPVFESIAFEKYGRNYYWIEWWNFTNAKCFCLFIAHHQKVNKSKINHDCDLYWFYQTWLHEYRFKCPLIWKYNFKTQKIFFCWKIITKKTHQGTVFFTFWFNNINGSFKRFSLLFYLMLTEIFWYNLSKLILL